MVAGYAGKENLRLESEIDERIHDLISLIERKYVCTDRSRVGEWTWHRKHNSLLWM